VRPILIHPDEEELVRKAVAGLKKAYNYRVDVKGPYITVHERFGEDPDKMATLMASIMGVSPASIAQHVREESDQHAHFAPVLRFRLENESARLFGAERWSWSSSINGWAMLSISGQLAGCVRRTVPTLGTERFFDLM
jgi:hypothetical protein